MKKMMLALSVLGLMLATAPPAQAASQLDFTVVNATGYGIKGLYVGPSASDSWGDNLLDEAFENGESVAITFSPKAESITKWDIMVEWIDEDDNVHWTSLDLSTISKITLKYNRESGKTTAVSE